MDSKTLDLRPFGVNYTLTSKSDFKDFVPSIVTGATRRSKSFIVNGKVYEIVKELGSGTYGVTYDTIHNNKHYAVKIIRFQDDEYDFKINFKLFVCEGIIQILLSDGSKYQPNGPFVPELYTIAYMAEKRSGVIVSELMRGTLHKLLDVYTKTDNDYIIPDALNQVAHILDFFGKMAKFNHRDLKPDNIMYVKIGEKRQFKLIDFGFSCIHWNGLKIQGNNYFRTTQSCYKTERDLAQLVYYIYMYFPAKITPKLDDFLHNFLHVKVGVSKCNMSKSCPRWHLNEWKNTYDFLNRKNVHSKSTRPNVFIEELQRFKQGKPFIGHTVRNNITRKVKKTANNVKTEPCPPGKIRNPKTQRCIKKPVPLVKRPCEKGKVRNPKTGRCITQKASSVKQIKVCPEGKILNPKTNRCVNVDGWAGKQLVQ